MDIDKNLDDLMKQAQSMQTRMQDAQKELGELVVVGEAGGGMVKVKLNGQHSALEVAIKPSLMDEDPKVVGDLCAAAYNDAARKIEVASKEKIAALTAGLKLPPELMQGK